MAKDLFFPGSILGLHRKAADALLAAGSGDAALLYLAFLSGKDGGALGWERDRLDKAHGLLLELGLADPQRPPVEPPPKKLEDTALPTYSTEDVKNALERDASFAGLVSAVEQRLGRGLVTQDVKDLMYLTDYLGLSLDVVYLLVNHCAEARRTGGKVTLNQIKKEGLRWQEAGVQTAGDADAYMARQSQRLDRHQALLALLDRPGRAPMKKEAEYLDTWIGWDLSDETIREAYERTVFQKGRLEWSYMNGILRSWHERGLHTIQDVRAAEQRHRRPAGEAGKAQAPAPVDTSDLDRLWAELNNGKEG